ncbi:MAG: response regulator transcription factor [Clostridia bacterium]|jgi:two-component system response regulator protein BraR/BceR|nr:response regulator transcription factor [Clostridia bacterium]
MKKILVVEDDAAIYEELTTLLAANGYEPVGEGECDLVLMDVGLPETDGFERVRKLRLKSKVPVIFLSARKNPEDELMGFGVGGDDYIAKPYNSAVLLARIGRLLKADGAIESRGLRLSGLKLTYQGNSIELTRNESKILELIMRKSEVGRDEVIAALWEDGMYIDDNTLNVNINRLRAKLKSIGAGGFVKTVRGYGYAL